MTHNIKIQESYADAVFSGEKSFEIRYNDRGYQKGDHVKFTVVNGDFYPLEVNHPLNRKEYEITYVLGGFHVDRDFVIFSIKEVVI